MNWFFIALLSPALWSITNHLDKYLLSRYFKGGGAGALIIFSSAIGLFVIPFILVFNWDVLHISFLNAFLIISASILGMVAILIYLYAMQKDETSIIVPLFQTIPIFSFILAYYVLGESLSFNQILGSLLVVVGAMVLSLDLSDKLPKLKTVILILMLFSSFLYALAGLIFKFVALDSDFWTTVFWSYIGDTLIAGFFILFIPVYRKEFIQVLKRNRIPVIGLNFLNEILSVVASLCLKFATLLAPLALVWVVNGFQPFFVFLYGVILTIFFPHLGSENLAKKHLIHKIISIGIMFIGTIFITL